MTVGIDPESFIPSKTLDADYYEPTCAPWRITVVRGRILAWPYVQVRTTIVDNGVTSLPYCRQPRAARTDGFRELGNN